MGWFSPSSEGYFVREYSPSRSSSHSHHHSSSKGHRSSSHRGSSTHRSHRPRDGYSDGYLKRAIYRAKRMVRRLIAYARRHPMKMFMMVIMPLISGGALAGVLKSFGIRLPGGVIGSLLGGRRGGFGDDLSSMGGRGGLSDLGGGGGIQSALKVVKMFM
ncbi:MAG: hypothetical protein M1825_004739 [Sarcosagium campestre]|nr:MAG: hypothetical protein M1825_004739 [Sarcosagium campestre]